MCVCVCVCFGWVKCRARIPSMGHRTWLYVTSLSLIIISLKIITYKHLTFTISHVPWSSTLVLLRAASSAHSCTPCKHMTVFHHCCSMYNTLNNPYAHPSYSHYYVLSPSTLFFFFCTSCCFLHILLFFAHLIVLHFFYFIAHFTLISLFFTICMPLCCVTLYNLYSYYFALSTERT